MWYIYIDAGLWRLDALRLSCHGSFNEKRDN